MPDTQLLATTERIALPPSAVLASRLGQRTLVPTSTPGGPEATLLPLLPDSRRTMVPGQLYPSVGNASHLLYLPAYAIASVVLTPAAQAAGGTLAVTLSAPAPAPNPGKTMAVVPHTLRAQLVYTLPNDAGQPTATVRKDFGPVSVPGSPLTFSTDDGSELGQIALALTDPQKAAWSTTIVLTAEMEVDVKALSVVLVDKAALFDVMRIDPARLASVVAPNVALHPTPLAVTPAAAAATPPAAMKRLVASDALRTTPAAPAPVGVSPFRPIAPVPPIRIPAPPPARPPIARPLPLPLPHGPILKPPPPIRPPPITTGVVTTQGETVLSFPLAHVTVTVPLGSIKLPTYTSLFPVPCDGVDLWVDQTVGHDFYYLPQSFRLGIMRADGGSVPTLLVSFDTASTDPAAIDTSLAVQVLPYVDPRDLVRARAAAAAYMRSHGGSGSPRLLVQEPAITQLEWWVPSAGGVDQSQAFAAPTAARTSFEQGLAATLTMSYPQFQRLIGRLMLPWAPGLQGAVAYVSPHDPTLTQSVPIEIDFRDFVGDVVTVSGGPAALTLSNALVCDVRVDALLAAAGGADGAFALRDAAGAAISSVVVPAGGSVTIAATGPGGGTPAIDEVAVVWSAVPTPAQLADLCAAFIGTQPAKEEPVSLAIETLPGFFRGGVGPRRLTKLTVAVSAGDAPVQVDLTATALTATASVAPPLLAALLNDPASRRFTYTVTNVYDDASTVVGPELVWEGGSPLVIEANPPEGPSHAAT